MQGDSNSPSTQTQTGLPDWLKEKTIKEKCLQEAIGCALRTWRAPCPGSQFRTLACTVGGELSRMPRYFFHAASTCAHVFCIAQADCGSRPNDEQVQRARAAHRPNCHAVARLLHRCQGTASKLAWAEARRCVTSKQRFCPTLEYVVAAQYSIASSCSLQAQNNDAEGSADQSPSWQRR